MFSGEKRWIVIMLAAFMVALLTFMYRIDFAHGHDHEHPNLDGWYASLMQPDNPGYSCCGVADAYWCDAIHVRGGKTFCTITDDRDDAELRHRTHVPVGTEIEIPDTKLKWEQGGKPIGNPTGHAVVFLTSAQVVLCFVQGTGI